MSTPTATTDKTLLKAEEIIRSGGVKRHTFKPSDTEIWTVVGSEGEYLVSGNPPLCTCPAFYFSVMRSRKKKCHHLVALDAAKRQGHFSVVSGHDEEIPVFLRLLWGRHNHPNQAD